MPLIAIAIIIAVAVGGGSAAVAQTALPDSAIWNFKAYVSEQVQTEFAFGGNAKADMDLYVIEVRLSEAERLISDSRLDAAVCKKIENSLNARVASLERRIARLREHGDFTAAADIAWRFQAAAAAHAALLSEAQANAEAGGSAAQKAVLGAFAERTRAMLDIASVISADASAAAADAF